MTANNELRKADRQIIEAHVERVIAHAKYVGALEVLQFPSNDAREAESMALYEARAELLAALTDAGL